MVGFHQVESTAIYLYLTYLQKPMVRKTKKGFKLVIKCDVCGKEDTRDIIECTCGQRFCCLCRDKHERDLFNIKKSKNHRSRAFHHETDNRTKSFRH